MSLLDLKTDLKSLKYGNDRFGGGSSDEPYIQTPIPSQEFTSFPVGDDFIRGGIQGAAQASATDNKRISKFFKNQPKGSLFVAKQVGLQLSNPKLEVKRGIGGFIESLILGDIGPLTGGLLQPTRTYNLGLNTKLQIPVVAYGIHYERHGLLPIQDDNTKYFAVAQFNNQGDSTNNRLIGLKNKLIAPPPPKVANFNILGNIIRNTAALFKIPYQPLYTIPKDATVDDYLGGPGSTYGLGRTIIRRFENTSNELSKTPIQDSINGSAVNYAYTLGLSKLYFTEYSTEQSNLTQFYSRQLPSNIAEYTNIDVNNPTNVPTQITQTAVTYSLSNGIKTYQSLRDQIERQKQLTYSTGVPKINAFGIYNNISKEYFSNDVGEIVYKNSYNKTVNIKIANWAEASREKRVGSGRQDIINLTPMFDEDGHWGGDKIPKEALKQALADENNNIRDLVRFRIQAVNTDDPSSGKWMVFRAYLTALSDSVDSNWNDIEYVGRGDKFYVYKGFSRKINISFKIATLSVNEMKFVYQKLNFLMGNLLPDYKNALMRGPLTRMSIGGWIDSQLGIINSLTLTVPNDSPWEISIDKPEGGSNLLILPHIVEVNLTFTPIGSETRGENLLSEKSTTVSHIAQNNTGDIKYQYIDLPEDIERPQETNLKVDEMNNNLNRTIEQQNQFIESFNKGFGLPRGNTSPFNYPLPTIN